MEIRIVRDKTTIASSSGESETYLVFKEEYKKGDEIIFSPKEKGFYTLQFDHTLGRSTLWSNGEDYHFHIPFNEKHDCYHPSAFKGELNYLWVRKAYKWESGYRNLALNPYDSHENNSLFPHSSANIETRGESVFASRNAIDGIVASNSHGLWPWASWGINKDPKAVFTLDFGRYVLVDRLIIYDRADFPHDAWWERATLKFSNNEELMLNLEKKDGPQEFTFSPQKISSLSLLNLIKADSPSPFPALIQLEVYGKEIE